MTSDKLSILVPKIGRFDIANAANFSQLASKERPSPEEQEALAFWGAERMRCLEAGRSFRAQYAPPGYAAVYESTQMSLVHLTAELFAGNITYGQFNTERNNINARANERMEQVKQNHMAVLNQDEERQSNTALQLMLQQQTRRTVNCTTIRLPGSYTATTTCR